MRNLAHFSIHNLNDLISERDNFFRVEDYIEVEFVVIASSPQSFLIVFRSDFDENLQQVSTQHHRLFNQRSFLLLTNPHRRVGLVFHIQLENFSLSFA